MDFSFGDLYPAMTPLATEHIANPDAEDQAALNENAGAAVETSIKESRPRFILLAVGVVALLAIFFGVN